MRKTIINFFFACGLLLTLAAFPVFAQETTPSKDVINKKPIQDFADFVSEKIVKNEVDLNAPFSIELEGFLNKDGKLDVNKSKFVKSEGDAQIIEVVKAGISAVSDSNLLAYLENLGVENVNLVVSQDANNFSAVIKSEVKSDARAKTLSSGFNTLLHIAKTDRKHQKEEVLLKAMRTSAQGKFFVLDFAMPKATLQELIRSEIKTIFELKLDEHRLRQPIRLDNPFKQFASSYKKQSINEPIDLNEPFNVVFEVNLDDQLNIKSAEYTKAEGSPEIVKIAKLGMEFITRTMAFQYFGKQTSIEISQDSTNLSVSFRFIAPSEKDALEEASKQNLDLGHEKVLPPNLDAESAELLLNVETKFKADGKFLIMEYIVPKQYIQKIIKQEFDKIEKD
jgi:hypothetical protein